MADVLRRAGLAENKDFIYREFQGAAHNETAWAGRFDQILIFLFGRNGG
jgi:enterochelin esterase-like enzyme